jgi:hypothetical protein
MLSDINRLKPVAVDERRLTDRGNQASYVQSRRLLTADS